LAALEKEEEVLQKRDLAVQNHHQDESVKMRVKPHVRCASIGSKHLKWIKAFIACIALLKRCRGVTLSFFRAQRRRSLVRIENFLDLLHIFLELLVGFPLLMKPSLNGMVRATHAK
jgi:hypothetical protein